MKETIVKQRKLYIDSLRGLAMIVVVYGHCLLSQHCNDYSIFFVFTSPFNVALFFVISGYLFTVKKDIKEFLKYLLTRLVIPWLVLGLFPYYNVMDRLPDILAGKNFWFMPALIIGEFFWYFLNKYIKKDCWIVIIGILISATGMFLHKLGWFDYAMINRAMTIQWLFIVGKYIRKYEYSIVDYIINNMAISLVIYIIMGAGFICLFPGQFYDVHLNRYYFIPLSWGMIILGVSIIFTFFKHFNYSPKWLVVIGQNTLPIYIYSDLGRHIFNKLLFSVNINNYTQAYPIIAILETAFACLICVAFSMLANKYVPEIVGRKRIKHINNLRE